MNLEVIARSQMVFSGPVEALVLPAVGGEMGVLAGHSDFIVMLKQGEVRFTGPGESRAIAIDGGYAEVSHDRVTVLPDAVSTTRVTHPEK